MIEFWNNLGKSAKFGLIGGIFALICFSGLLSYTLLKSNYEILFSDLSPQSTASIVSELERLKVPYKLGDTGNSVLVEAKEVHKTRLKLMGKELPLQGAVGFEVFSNSDFGMTEFAQRINYQRALQGELTRTILSLNQVREARVHIVLAEQGLFKQAGSRPKAAITLSMKPGMTLQPEQVTGIQRLVAASVPGISAQDVTIVDQEGVALTRPSTSDGEGDAGANRLVLKKDTENYLSRKASQVLERMYGAGQTLTSVDVTLNMEKVQTTTEDVIPAQGRSGQANTGIVLRERESIRDMAAPLDARSSEMVVGSKPGNSQREVDYVVGRRVEQVIGQPGSIRRIHVLAVVRTPMDADQLEKTRKIVASAVGAQPERGDTVIVQLMGAVIGAGVKSDLLNSVVVPESIASGTLPNASAHNKSSQPLVEQSFLNPYTIGILGLFIVAVMGVLLMLGSKNRKQANPVARTLTNAERKVIAAKVQAWVNSPGELK